MNLDRAIGAIYGLAFGDAWGYLTEFYNLKQIAQDFGPSGPDFPLKAKISDDTQMSLAVLTALAPLGSRPRTNSALGALASSFLNWLHDPDNTRAPGSTCLNALNDLESGGLSSWTTSTVVGSKGCGANMRAPWLGLMGYAEDDIVRLASLQAAITHGHPTGVVSAVVTALVVARLVEDKIRLAHVLDEAIDITEELMGRVPDLSFLEMLPVLTAGSNEQYWLMGCREVLSALLVARERAAEADFVNNPWSTDPSLLGGEGWIAEEALATSLLIAQTFADKAMGGLRRAMLTVGDSDSIGAITGAFLGAALGDVWPAQWKQQLEPRYQQELAYAVQLVESQHA